MSTRNHTHTRINNVFKYSPAKLCPYTAGWTIDYSVEDPYSGQMRRKQIKLKRIVARFRTKRAARAYALDMVAQINQSLRQGEHPLTTRDNARLLTPASIARPPSSKRRPKSFGRARSDRTRRSPISSDDGWEWTNAIYLVSSYRMLQR